MTKIKRHIITVIVDNEFGVLARVIGLFSGRGYNIESLTVANISKTDNFSRITICTSGTDQVITQIKALLARQIPVHKVHDIKQEGEHIERELALVKIFTNSTDTREKSLNIANIYGAKIVDNTVDCLVFELSTDSDKIEQFIKEQTPLGLVEIARTGTTAIWCGKKLV